MPAHEAKHRHAGLVASQGHVGEEGQLLAGRRGFGKAQMLFQDLADDGLLRPRGRERAQAVAGAGTWPEKTAKLSVSAIS